MPAARQPAGTASLLAHSHRPRARPRAHHTRALAAREHPGRRAESGAGCSGAEPAEAYLGADSKPHSPLVWGGVPLRAPTQARWVRDRHAQLGRAPRVALSRGVGVVVERHLAVLLRTPRGERARSPCRTDAALRQAATVSSASTPQVQHGFCSQRRTDPAETFVHGEEGSTPPGGRPRQRRRCPPPRTRPPPVCGFPRAAASHARSPAPQRRVAPRAPASGRLARSAPRCPCP